MEEVFGAATDVITAQVCFLSISIVSSSHPPQDEPTYIDLTAPSMGTLLFLAIPLLSPQHNNLVHLVVSRSSPLFKCVLTELSRLWLSKGTITLQNSKTMPWTVEGQAITFVPGLRAGKCAPVWEWHWGSLRQRARMQSFVFGATSAWQHHFWSPPAPERASMARSSIAATGTSLSHVSAEQKKLKGLLASRFPGLQFLRPPHTASVLGDLRSAQTPH